jgi:plastocyanin
MRRTLSIALVVATLGLVGCSGSSGDSASETPSTGSSSAGVPSQTGPSQATPVADAGSLPLVTQVVKHIAYQSTQLSIKADKSYALQFENKDSGISHSMAIYDDDDFPLDTTSSVLFSFAPFSGVADHTYVIPPLNKGTYLFQCAVHHKMQGTIFVGIK